MRQVGAGSVELHTRSELLDVVTKDGQACGIVVRDLLSGEVTSHSAHAYWQPVATETFTSFPPMP